MPPRREPTQLEREAAAREFAAKREAHTRAVPDDVIGRLRLAARGRLAYAQRAGKYEETLRDEAREYLRAAALVEQMMNTELLQLSLPTWLFEFDVTEADLTAFDEQSRER